MELVIRKIQSDCYLDNKIEKFVKNGSITREKSICLYREGLNGGAVGCSRKPWELTGPDVTFCLCGMFSPLLGFRAPFARVINARALNVRVSPSL